MTPGLSAMLRGMGAAVAGFVLIVTGRMAQGAFRGAPARSVAIAGAAFVAVALLRLNSYLVLLVLGAVSLWLHRPGTETRSSGEGEPAP